MMTVTWVAVAQKAEWDINYRLKSLDTIYNSGWGYYGVSWGY